MNLFEKTKSIIGSPDAAFADSEILILNRRAYLISQLSGANGFLDVIKQQRVLSLAERQLLSYMEILSDQIQPSKEICLTIGSKGMLLYALYFFYLNGDRDFLISTPNPIPRLTSASRFMREILDDFLDRTRVGLNIEKIRDKYEFGVTLCHVNDSSSVMLGIKNHSTFINHYLIFQDYARTKAKDQREQLERAGIFPYVTLEGHGVACKLTG